MKKNLFILATLTFIYTFLSFPQTGTNPGMAQAQTKPTVNSFQCTITNIASVQVANNTIPSETDRIYVQCATSPLGILFSFASAVTTTGDANRYLVMLNTAVALGKTVTVYYDINSANNPAGCLTSDCRKLTGLVLGP